VRVFPSSTTATEHGVASPLRLRAGEWLEILEGTGKAFLADDCMGLAQQIAFTSLLAFFPAAILVIGLLGLIPGAYDSLVNLLGTVAPQAVLNAIDVARQSSAGRGVGSGLAVAAGTVGALWAATGAMGSVIKAVNRAHDVRETRPLWRVRLLALELVFAAALVLTLVFVLIVFGGPLGDAVARRAGLGHEFAILWGVARWPIAFAGILLFLGLVYYLAPAEQPTSRRLITPGCLVGAFLWLAISGLFALYTTFSSSYDRTYGSLAGAIVLLLWLNYSAVALLLGAELNAELGRRSRR
jgi:membrane protein